jgi:hypothetical protein
MRNSRKTGCWAHTCTTQQGPEAALAAPQAQDQMQRAAVPDAAVRQRAGVLQLPASVDEPLVAGRDPALALRFRRRPYISSGELLQAPNGPSIS